MEKIERLIPLGKEKAIHQDELSKLLGVSCGTVKAMIREARQRGLQIISGAQGYYFAKDDEELKAFVRMQSKQALARLKTIKPIKDDLKEFKGQISLSDFITDLSEEAMNEQEQSEQREQKKKK